MNRRGTRKSQSLAEGLKFALNLIEVELHELKDENLDVQSFFHSERIVGTLTILGLLHDRIIAQLPDNERAALSLQAQLLKVGRDVFRVNEMLELKLPV